MELKYVNCPTNALEIKDFKGMEFYNGYLFVNQERFLSVWDAKEPTNLQKVAEFPFPSISIRGMRLFGNTLYVYGTNWRQDEPHIHIFDVSNPLQIKQVKELQFKPTDECVYSVAVSNGHLLAATAAGVYDCESNKLLCENTDKHGYPADIIASDEWLLFSGCHEGVRIFRFLPDGNVELVKHIDTQYYMPDGLHWDVQGKSFIICGGDESVLKFDMSVPEKTKRVKGAKTGIELCRQYVRENNLLLVFGLKSQNSPPDKPFVVEVDISADIPVVVQKHEIKGFKPKGTGSDGARGIIKTGNYLFVATAYCQLGVVEII